MLCGDVCGDAGAGVVAGYAADVDDGAAVFDDFHFFFDTVERANDVDIDLGSVNMDGKGIWERNPTSLAKYSVSRSVMGKISRCSTAAVHTCQRATQ